MVETVVLRSDVTFQVFIELFTYRYLPFSNELVDKTHYLYSFFFFFFFTPVPIITAKLQTINTVMSWSSSCKQRGLYFANTVTEVMYRGRKSSSSCSACAHQSGALLRWPLILYQVAHCCFVLMEQQTGANEAITTAHGCISFPIAGLIHVRSSEFKPTICLTTERPVWTWHKRLDYPY